MDLLPGLEAFAVQFRAQVANAGAPTSEHDVHFCLALGLQAAYEFPLGSIVFERTAGGRRRIDLWVMPLDLAIEVKFRRPIPSGLSRPVTQHYGGLLADFSKIAAVSAAAALVVLVADGPAIASLQRNTPQLLPFTVGDRRTVRAVNIAGLPATAATHAVADGHWTLLTAELVWADRCDGWHLLAWRVQPDFDSGKSGRRSHLAAVHSGSRSV